MSEDTAVQQTLAAEGARGRSMRSISDWVDRNLPFVFNVPTVLFLFGLVAFPVALVILTSFSNWQLITNQEPSLVGFENYLKVWGDERWLAAIWHTFYYAIATVFGQLVLGLATAMLFNRSFAGKAFYRSIWMMPMIAMSTAISLVWILFFDNAYGMLNFWLSAIGLDPIEWTSSPEWAMPSLILVGIWHHTPFMTLILLAGLQSLPQDPFEAARIDGASRWAVFRHIQLPKMRSVLLIAFLLRFMDSFMIYTELFVVTGGGPGNSTTLLSIDLVKMAIGQFDLGPAAAFSIVYFLIILLLSWVFYTIMTGVDEGRSGYG